MPVFLQINNNQQIYETLSVPPIIINDIPNTTEADKAYLLNTISTTYTDDLISMLPSCSCKKLKGEARIGEICPDCLTPVRNAFEEEIMPILWFRRPNGVAPLLNPYIWHWLKKRFVKSGFNIIQWLTDPDYTTKVRQPIIINKLTAMGFRRNYNFFVENFDDILSFLFSLSDFRVKKKLGSDDLYDTILAHRSILFSDYIPLPNKAFLITELTNTGKYVDEVALQAKNAILALASIDKDFYDQDVRVKQNRTARAMNALVDFYEKYIRTSISQKPGQIRKHICGTRSIFTFRHVITSIEGIHKYDEIHVPWVVGLTTFRPQMLNKLLKRGYCLNDAVGLMMSHTHKYHPLLAELMDELLAEATVPGEIPCRAQRNRNVIFSMAAGFLR